MVMKKDYLALKSYFIAYRHVYLLIIKSMECYLIEVMHILSPDNMRVPILISGIHSDGKYSQCLGYNDTKEHKIGLFMAVKNRGVANYGFFVQLINLCLVTDILVQDRNMSLHNN